MFKTRIILVYFLTVMVLQVNAQEPLKHEKRIYVSPEGKIFIQKQLPVYLRISTSPDKNTESYLLRSEHSKKYTNPMYFDTEGYNTIRSPSAVDTSTLRPIYPLEDIIFEVYTDSKPPKTSLNFEDAYLYKKDGKFYCGNAAEITLTAFDNNSGVQKTYFSIDNATFSEYSNSIKLEKEKEYIYKYYSVDNVGNVEDIKTRIISIDLNSPKTTLEVQGDKSDNILSARSIILLKVTDDISKIANTFYSIDNNPEKTYNNPTKASWLSEGDHTITYYSIDNVKHQESKITYSFYVDKTPPIVVEEFLGSSFVANGKEYSSGRTKLKLTAVDNKAGVKAVYFSINRSEFQLYEKPVYLPKNSGALNIKTYAIDNVNNKSTGAQSRNAQNVSYMDLTGPDLTYRFSGPLFKTRDTVFINQETKISLAAKDVESGFKLIEYSINNEENIIYDAPFSIAEEGSYQINFTGYDNVDNSNSNNLKVFVDNTGPEIFSHFSILPINKKRIGDKIIDIYPGYVVLFLSSTDKSIGYDNMYYSINNELEKLYAGLIENFDQGKDYILKVRAQDKLGNQTDRVIEFSTDY